MVDRVDAPTPNPGDSEDVARHEENMAKKGEEVNIRSVDRRSGEALSEDSNKGENVRPDDNKNDGESNEPERPEWIPEKFWTGDLEESAQKLAESYRELERQRSKPDDKDKGDDDADRSPEDEDKNEPDQQNAIARARQEFDEKGELSDDTYAALEAAGLSREQVDTYIEAAQGKATEAVNAALEAAGGQDEFDRMAEWAGENLDRETVQDINEMLASTNPRIARRGAELLKSEYQQNATIEPEDNVRGETGGNTSGDYFRSRHEMIQAMSDPRYKRDPAFREEVERKLLNAEKRGIDVFAG